jgi:hypothetical protein
VIRNTRKRRKPACHGIDSRAGLKRFDCVRPGKGSADTLVTTW